MTARRCDICGYSDGGSHYHCFNCGEVSSMFGHWRGPEVGFACVRVVPATEREVLKMFASGCHLREGPRVFCGVTNALVTSFNRAHVTCWVCLAESDAEAIVQSVFSR